MYSVMLRNKYRWLPPAGAIRPHQATRFIPTENWEKPERHRGRWKLSLPLRDIKVQHNPDLQSGCTLQWIPCRAGQQRNHHSRSETRLHRGSDSQTLAGPLPANRCHSLKVSGRVSVIRYRLSFVQKQRQLVTTPYLLWPQLLIVL